MKTDLLSGKCIVLTKPTNTHGETSMLSEIQAVVLQAIINLPKSDRERLLAQIVNRDEAAEAEAIAPIYAAN